MALGFQNLEVWKASIELLKGVYDLTKSFPKEELFCLTQHIRKTSISIPSNIAEGSAKHSKKDFIRFISIAQGSVAELKTQIIIAKELEYINSLHSEEYFDKADKISRMLKNLEKSMNT